MPVDAVDVVLVVDRVVEDAVLVADWIIVDVVLVVDRVVVVDWSTFSSIRCLE